MGSYLVKFHGYKTTPPGAGGVISNKQGHTKYHWGVIKNIIDGEVFVRLGNSLEKNHH